MNLHTEVEIFKTLRERLKTAFDLDDEDQTLADTLEGATRLQEAIVQLVREAQRAKVFANSIKPIIADNIARLSRFERKYDKLRLLVSWAMDDAGLSNITEPDMTITHRKGQPKLLTPGTPPDSTTPYTETHITYSWDMDALRAAVERGDQQAMAIAYFSNPKPVLTVRTK